MYLRLTIYLLLSIVTFVYVLRKSVTRFVLLFILHRSRVSRREDKKAIIVRCFFFVEKLSLDLNYVD